MAFPRITGGAACTAEVTASEPLDTGLGSLKAAA
jgi:hypothetical protein